MRPLGWICTAFCIGALVSGCSSTGPATPAASTGRSAGSAPAGGASTASDSSSSSGPGGTSAPVAVTASTARFHLPAAVSRPVVFADGQGLRVVGGLTSADTTTADILAVDPASGSSHPAARLKVGVHDAAGAVVAGRDLLFGGGSTSVSSAVQDVTPTGTPRLVGHLPTPRADLVAVAVGGKAYVLGGFDGTRGLPSVLRTSDGSTFTTVARVPVSVRYPAVAVTGQVIWLFGGEDGSGAAVSDVQRIDLATGRATVAGHLPRALSHAGAFVLGGSIFIAGGRVGGSAVAAVQRFDPGTVTVSPAGKLPAPRSDFGVTVVADTAYLVGGENPKPVDTVVEVRARQ